MELSDGVGDGTDASQAIVRIEEKLRVESGWLIDRGRDEVVAVEVDFLEFLTAKG